jgi:hypothetical protein
MAASDVLTDRLDARVGRPDCLGEPQGLERIGEAGRSDLQ